MFCSKNYAPILPYINSITERFHTYFHYTITAYGKEIEPGVPGIDESMATLAKLSEVVGANRIAWRYDPVLLTSEYTVRRHLETFERMASFLSGHIDRCIFSFVEMYRKLQTNMPELIPLTEKDKEELAAGLGAIAAEYKIPIQTCGTNGDYTHYGISSSGCMTLNILGQANGVQFRNLKHQGMRQGCHCIESRAAGNAKELFKTMNADAIKVREIQVKSILSTSNLPVADYSVNPYVGCPHACKYCYASFMKRFTGHPEPWGTFLDVKYWPEIRNPGKYAGKQLFIGSVTDPYGPQEEIYKRTRALLEQLQGSGAEISIATKSDLVLRDLDLIKTFPHARVSWSVNTLDERFQADMDMAVSISRRLAAMKAFHEAGIRTTCFISPIFPGITDIPAIVEQAEDKCNLIWLENLNLRGSYKSVILEYINKRYPHLAPLYREIYQKGSRGYWEELDAAIRQLAEKRGLPYLRNDDSMHRPFNEPPVIVNYFYHEQIKRSAMKKEALPNPPPPAAAFSY